MTHHHRYRVARSLALPPSNVVAFNKADVEEPLRVACASVLLSMMMPLHSSSSSSWRWCWCQCGSRLRFLLPMLLMMSLIVALMLMSMWMWQRSGVAAAAALGAPPSRCSREVVGAGAAPPPLASPCRSCGSATRPPCSLLFSRACQCQFMCPFSLNDDGDGRKTTIRERD